MGWWFFLGTGKRIATLLDANTSVFDSLSRKYNDTTYNAMVAGDLEYRAIASVVSDISITSNADYDAEHPSGSVLNGVASIRFQSYAPFVNCGYNADSLKGKSCFGTIMLYDMPLDEFSPAYGSLWSVVARSISPRRPRFPHATRSQSRSVSMTERC